MVITVVMSLIASLSVALVAALSSQAAGASSGSANSTLGTSAYRNSHSSVPRRTAVAQDSGDGSDDALNSLYSAELTGGYVASGVGLRDLGHGRIVVSQIPSGSSVAAAFLMWDVLDNFQRAADSRGQLNGVPFVGKLVGTGRAPCWPASNNYAYYSDVTKQITGNGGYVLSGMPSGTTNGADPFNGGGDIPYAEGASLVVVYRNAASPQTFVSIKDGGEETPDQAPTLVTTFSGFGAASPVQAKTTYVVADGQTAADGPIVFDGAELPGDFGGYDPQAVSPYSQGDLWDTRTYDVSADMPSGSTTASASISATGDCLVWIGQVLSVASGASAGRAVVSFGDSVAAGEGGPTPAGAGSGVAYTGYPYDGTKAYPAVLANRLGATNYNFAQSGACASSGKATNTALPNCNETIQRTKRPNTVEDELLQARPLNLHPSLVTLTVGADDLNFASCIQTIAGFPPSGKDAACSDSAADLAKLQANVVSVLEKINVQYPGVPVLMTRYYNPFPTSFPIKNTASICSTTKILYAADQVRQHNYKDAALAFVTDDAGGASNKFFAGILAQGAAIEAKLNATLAAAAAQAKAAVGMSVTTAALNFAGHDFCQDYPGGSTGWVLAPRFYAYASANVGIFSKSITIDYEPSDTCVTYDAGCKSQTLVNTDGSTAGVHYHLTAIANLNDIPHPTIAGQAAIASQLTAAATKLIGPAPAAARRAVLRDAVHPLDIGDPGSVTGTVTDAADPGGLPGVCVNAWSADGGTGYGSTTTGDDGLYELDGLPADSYTIEFDPTCSGSVASVDAPELAPSDANVTSASGASGVDAVLTPAASIAGVVTDAANPAGLAGVCATAVPSDGGIGFATTTTADDGSYTLGGLPAGTYVVRFDPTCNGTLDSSDVALSDSVTLTAGQSRDGLDVALSVGGALAGTVTDAANPGGVAGVCITATSSDGGTDTGTATTDSDGNYEIDGLVPDSYVVEFDPSCGGSIVAADLGPVSSAPVVVSGGQTAAGVDQVLVGAGSITGTVTDADNPGGLASVCITVTQVSGGSGAGAATTAGDGTYSVDGLPPGQYELDVDPTCNGTVETSDEFAIAGPITVAGNESASADVVLVIDGGMSGVVTDAAHPAGLSGVCVAAAATDGSGTGQATTGSDGSYTVDGLPSGSYTVSFDPTCGGTRASGDEPFTATSPVDVVGPAVTDGVDEELTSGGAISGKVIDARHQTGLGSVCVTATSATGAGGFGAGVTAADGTYTISNLTADSYTLVFDPTCGGTRTSTDVLTSAAQPVTVANGLTSAVATMSLAVAMAPRLTRAAPARYGFLKRAYRYTFAVRARPAATFAVSSGRLPSGLTLNPLSGLLSGTPKKAGSYRFRITASSGVGPSATSRVLTIVVGKRARPRFTAEAPRRTVVIGARFRYRFTAIGFPTPSFAVASGALPRGLALNTRTGVLSGLARARGTFHFTVSASNGVRSAAVTRQLTIVVSSAR